MTDITEAPLALSSMDPDRWQRVSRHLDQVLDLPEIDWAGYVAALSREDAVTVTDLERLLHRRQHRHFADFLAARTPAAPEAPASSLIGRQVGPYVIGAELGR